MTNDECLMTKEIRMTKGEWCRHNLGIWPWKCCLPRMEAAPPTTESESDRAPSLLWRFLLAAWVAALLYVLSVGPVAKFVVDGKIPLSILFVYEPLGYAADRV